MDRPVRTNIPLRYAIIVTWRLLIRYSLFFLLIAAISLLVLSHFNNKVRDITQEVAAEIGAPFIYLLARPIEAMRGSYETVESYFFVHEKNETLRKKLEASQSLREVILALRADNKKLRELLNVIEEQNYNVMTTRVLGDVGGLFRDAILLHNEDGKIKKGYAVLAGNVLLGSVTDITLHTARVRLISDIESKVPIISETSNERAIAQGANTDKLMLKYQQEEHKMEVGERIITSGDGNFFKAGIPVGEISDVAENGSIYIRPFYNASQLDYVHVMLPEE